MRKTHRHAIRYVDLNCRKGRFYEKNKAQYLLSHPVLKCIIAKVPAKSSDIKNIYKALGKSDLTEAMF